MANNDISFEPMDVDLSTNSVNNSVTAGQIITQTNHLLNESDNVPEAARLSATLEESSGSFKPEVWNVNKFHIIRKTEKSTYLSPQFLVLALLVLPLTAIMLCISNIQCIDDLDLKKLKIKLDNRLYGQPKAIKSFIEALSEDSKSKIIFMYGGTGVGKTYTISLAFENVWNSTNVYHYTMPSFGNTFTTETMLGLNICDTSVVVVDDLRQNDFEVKEKIVEIIEKSENLNRKITVILVYNCDIITKDFVKKCDQSFHSELFQAFEDVKVYKKFIEFKPLTEEVLKMCIEDELRDKTIGDSHFSNILNNFNVTLDGCKGVYKKIKFLNLQ
ncbi:uncharacterized protein LOC114364285 [Ostrinia furnacalis]|uniref:uncharacterized protein LOC114364285 n=1 Tax=Ostrinia furnacalis TaxID=93504 RepID=UPI00103B7839|nr:uncharacterized protein LOC114364285 [Ostrinia furnacalis]